MFLASSTGRFPIYFFVPCLLRDNENEELNIFKMLVAYELTWLEP